MTAKEASGLCVPVDAMSTSHIRRIFRPKAPKNMEGLSIPAGICGFSDFLHMGMLSPKPRNAGTISEKR
jgi:hypothetical protein